MCPMCDGAGRIGAQETVVVPSQGVYTGPIGGWVTKDALSQAPIVTWGLEVPAPGYEAGQEAPGGGRSRHDRSHETSARTSSPI